MAGLAGRKTGRGVGPRASACPAGGLGVGRHGRGEPVPILVSSASVVAGAASCRSGGTGVRRCGPARTEIARALRRGSIGYGRGGADRPRKTRLGGDGNGKKPRSRKKD